LKLKFGYSISWSSFEEITSRSIEAEKFGFDSIWYHDHLMIPGSAPVLESFSVLTAIATKTNHCKIGQSVVDTSRRHPATIAHSTLTLNHISNGRAFVGLGAGESMNLVPLGLNMKKPLKRLRESIQFVKGVFNATKNSPFNFSGEIFSAKNIFLNVNEKIPTIPPIYVGASGPQTREITGELADGWVPYVHSLSNYEKLLKDIKKGVEKSRRKISDLDLVANIPVLITKDENDSRKKKIGRSLAIRLLLERNTLRDLGWNKEIPNEFSQSDMIVDESISKKLEQEADKIPSEITEQIAAIGKPSEIIEVLENYKKMGAKNFLIKFLGPINTDDLKKFNSEIIQIMKNA
jgi:5,10-methylenetetrahydromethanopterin reductase/phthiodiolone/phenolphthiodiolone dimycocerosates ketoreductase|tara:strand:- start:2964 stop:4010 length:1047 start_codon:yes stop_codon:yes gene_type:complete